MWSHVIMRSRRAMKWMNTWGDNSEKIIGDFISHIILYHGDPLKFMTHKNSMVTSFHQVNEAKQIKGLKAYQMKNDNKNVWPIKLVDLWHLTTIRIHRQIVKFNKYSVIKYFIQCDCRLLFLSYLFIYSLQLSSLIENHVSFLWLGIGWTGIFTGHFYSENSCILFWSFVCLMKKFSLSLSRNSLYQSNYVNI